MKNYEKVYEEADYKDLLGETFEKVYQVGVDQIHFVSLEGRHWVMCHEQACCEDVQIEDIVGNLNDLIGHPLLMAEEAVSEYYDPEEVAQSDRIDKDRDSWTWTFYKFATQRGYVTIRWYGESNGFYSERVDLFLLIKRPKE